MEERSGGLKKQWSSTQDVGFPILSSKPLGLSKVNSTFHLSQVD